MENMASKGYRRRKQSRKLLVLGSVDQFGPVRGRQIVTTVKVASPPFTYALKNNGGLEPSYQLESSQANQRGVSGSALQDETVLIQMCVSTLDGWVRG